MKHFLLFSFSLFLILPMKSQTVRVMTYNIRYDNPNDGPNAWPKRKAYLASQVRFYGPDIWGIQEGLDHQVTYLKAQFPAYGCVGVGRDDGEKAGEYCALFFKKDAFRLLQNGTFWLSETPEQPSVGWDASMERICTFIQVKHRKSNKKLWVFNAHFDHIGKEARKQSVALILQKIEKMALPKDAVIFMGDLNLEPSSAPIKLLREHLSDSYVFSKEGAFGPIGTFNAFKFQEPVTKRIDYIFVKKAQILVQKYAVLSDSKDCHYPSDHLPVLVEMEVGKRKE